MILRKLVDDIEDGLALANLSLASTTHSLLRRLEENSTVSEARRRLEESPGEASLILERAVRSFESPAPEGYSHPGDLALSAYLYVLARVPGPGIQRFVTRVAEAERREFFSATAIAKYLTSVVPATTAAPEAVRPVLLTGHLLTSTRPSDPPRDDARWTTVTGADTLSRADIRRDNWAHV